MAAVASDAAHLSWTVAQGPLTPPWSSTGTKRAAQGRPVAADQQGATVDGLEPVRETSS